METALAERTYTEDGKRYVFRDVQEGGVRRTQYLVKEKWGEDMWTDCDPDADSDVAGARPYDSPNWPNDPLYDQRKNDAERDRLESQRQAADGAADKLSDAEDAKPKAKAKH